MKNVRFGALFILAILAPLVAGAGTTVKLSGDDAMKLNMTSFSVKAGEKVTLEYRHTGKLPKVAMGHNLVILKAGVDVDKFAQQAAVSPKTGYIPRGGEKHILAKTKMLGGGEKDTIRFTAPAPGNYTFICTFPGHYAIMRGTMKVK